MKLMKRLAALLLAGAVGSGTFSHSGTLSLSVIAAAEESDPIIEVNITGTENYKGAFEIMELTNRARTQGGKPDLKMDQTLMEAAMTRAFELSLLYEHTRPNGSSWSSLVTSGYFAENLMEDHEGTDSGAEFAVNAWLNSEEHYNNLMGNNQSDYKSVGIGYATIDGKSYYVQIFSSEETSNEAALTADTVQNTRRIRTRESLAPGGSVMLSAPTITIQNWEDKDELPYTPILTVTITAEEGADIYYAADGGTEKKYTGAFDLPEGKLKTVVTAYAVKNGVISDTATKTHNWYPIPIATPTISPNGGNFTESQTVTIDWHNPYKGGGELYYTLDGSEPTENSIKYTIPFTITEDTEIKVFARIPIYGGEWLSTTESVVFTKTDHALKPGFLTPAGETNIKEVPLNQPITQKSVVLDGRYSERFIKKVSVSDLAGKKHASFVLSNGTVTETVSTARYYTALTADGEKVKAGDGYAFLVYTLSDIPDGVTVFAVSIVLE